MGFQKLAKMNYDFGMLDGLRSARMIYCVQGPKRKSKAFLKALDDEIAKWRTNPPPPLETVVTNTQPQEETA